MGKGIRVRVLFDRLRNYAKNHSALDVDDAVNYLTLNFSEYKRTKFTCLRKFILPILTAIQNDDNNSFRTPPSKRRKKNINSLEDEYEYLNKGRSRDEAEEEEDGEESTSSHIRSEEEEKDLQPKFEPMKQNLISNYSNSRLSSAANAVPANLESKVEVGVIRSVSVDKNIEVAGMERKIETNGNPDVSAVDSMIQGKSESKSKVGFIGKMVGLTPTFEDFGGMQQILDELEMDVIIPLCQPQLPQWYGVELMTGILLHGPPGCGKTKLAHAIANETRLPFYKISAAELVSGVSGESEEKICNLFLKAHRTAPSILFIDEIDAIASKRENLQRETERRIVTQLMTCMDESHQTVGSADLDSNLKTSGKRTGNVLVIGATNRPDALDPALRRPGRFDREIALGIPNENARLEILSMLTKNFRIEGEHDLQKIARLTPGFVGADLVALVNTAKNLAMRKNIIRRKSELCAESGCKENKEELRRRPWLQQELERHPITMADFEKVGADMDTGFLLYGPPGCGKTLIAKAVANEAGANFIYIKGPELLNMYVGESELAVRRTFSRARACSPCILFFDEVDALTTERKEGRSVVDRVLTQLLIELDGADQRKGVFVIGATNRPDVMDRALLRPGRFGKLVYVPLPGPNERASILKAIARKKDLCTDIDLDALARSDACANLSGADLLALMHGAVIAAIEEKRDQHKDGEECLIQASHFVQALKTITPSISDKQWKNYEVLSRTLGRGV